MHWLLYMPVLLALAYLPRAVHLHSASSWLTILPLPVRALLRAGALVLIAALAWGHHYAIALLATVAFAQLSEGGTVVG